MKNVIKKIRHTIIPAVYLILERDNKILMLRRFNTGYCDGQYSLVAGHVDAGESVTTTMIREAREEANIVVELSGLHMVHMMHRKSSVDAEERIDVFFKATTWQGEIKNCEPHKCDDLGWFAYNQLPKDTIDHVRFALEQSYQGIFFSEFGW